jgi:hypothetical protein
MADSPWYASAYFFISPAFGRWNIAMVPHPLMLPWLGPLSFFPVSTNAITTMRVLLPRCPWNSGKITDHSTCNSRISIQMCLQQCQNTEPIAWTQMGITLKRRAMANRKSTFTFYYWFSLLTFACTHILLDFIATCQAFLLLGTAISIVCKFWWCQLM